MNAKSKFGAVVAATTFALALSACGSSADTQASVPAVAASASTGASAGAAGGEFGPGCAAVPTDPSNPGSFDAMAKQPVATAASGNPLLKTLTSAVTAAELGDTLNSAKDITVFAPTNDAFAKIPKADLEAVLADKATLTKILTYHVVPGQLTPDQIAGTHKTLEGADLTVTGSGESFKVNGANIVCGNVKTSNATVYIVDGVLMPPA